MDKKDSKLKNIFDKIKSIKHIEIIIAVIAVLIMLIIYFSSFAASSSKKKDTAVSTQSSDYCARMKQDITKAVADMCGSSPTVVINWDGGVESIIAYITSTSANGSTSSPQIITSQGTSSPIILKEIYPKALGVIVICQGGDNVKIKLDIISAISVLLDISPEKINVFPAKK